MKEKKTSTQIRRRGWGVAPPTPTPSRARKRGSLHGHRWSDTQMTTFFNPLAYDQRPSVLVGSSKMFDRDKDPDHCQNPC